MNHLIKTLIGIAMILGISSCAVGHFRKRVSMRDEGGESKRGDGRLAVLFVGNSYSFGVPKAFEKVARKHRKKVVVGNVTNGGWTLEQHVKDGAALKEIRKGGWDVVVLQEQSRIPSLSNTRERRMFPNVKVLADEARGQGAVPVLYQTWGYREGDSDREGDDFHAMTGRLREGYKEAAESAGGLLVVPVGDAWEREAWSGGLERLYQEDGSHPSRAGDKITAETFFQTLFRE